MITAVVPFYEGLHFYDGVGVVAVIVGLWVKPVGPWVKPKFRAWRDRRLLLHGRPASDVAEEVPPLSRRLKRFEKRLDDTTRQVGEVIKVTERLDEGQVAIIERQDEHASTVARVEGQVKQIAQGQTKALEMLSHLFENGDNSNNPGDLYARMARRQGAYLENPELPTYDPHVDVSHDRREDDKK